MGLVQNLKITLMNCLSGWNVIVWYDVSYWIQYQKNYSKVLRMLNLKELWDDVPDHFGLTNWPLLYQLQ